MQFDIYQTKNCTHLLEYRPEWDLELPTCRWPSEMDFHLQHCNPPSLSPSLLFSPPPTFCLSALSSVQLFTFSKVIYFQDNLIMSKPTLLCSVTTRMGQTRKGSIVLIPFALHILPDELINCMDNNLRIIWSGYRKQLPSTPSHFLITLLYSCYSSVPYLLFQR